MVVHREKGMDAWSNGEITTEREKGSNQQVPSPPPNIHFLSKRWSIGRKEWTRGKTVK